MSLEQHKDLIIIEMLNIYWDVIKIPLRINAEQKLGHSCHMYDKGVTKGCRCHLLNVFWKYLQKLNQMRDVLVQLCFIFYKYCDVSNQRLYLVYQSLNYTCINDWDSKWENSPSDICPQWRFKSACTYTQSDQTLLCPHKEILHTWLLKMRPVKILIWLRKCASWS